MRFVLPLSVLAAVSAFTFEASAKATFTITTTDAAGTGFNDTTAVVEIDNNTGTTIGAQRMNVVKYAADQFADVLESPVPITVNVRFIPLSCTATTGVLASGSPSTTAKDFTNAPRAGTFYVAAVANRYAGVDVAPDTLDLSVTFNANIGSGAGCLDGSSWYYGLNGAASQNDFNMLGYALREMAHGLGVHTLVSKTGPDAGKFFSNTPDAFAINLYDTTVNKSWRDMTDAERATSLVNSGHVIWSGPNVNAIAASTLQPGVAALRVNSPSAIVGRYPVGTASYGSPLTATQITADLAYVDDTSGSKIGCAAYATGVLTGKIALIDRGTCGFAVKTKNAQDAGALAVLIVDTTQEEIPTGLGGTDATVTVPTARVRLNDGTAIEAAIAGSATVNVSLGLDTTLLNGADESGRVRMYAPSISNEASLDNFDTDHAPASVAQNGLPPSTLDAMTIALMRDIGWLTDTDGDGIDDSVDNCPNVANANQADANNDKVGDACAPADGTDGGGDTNGNGQTDGSKKDDGGCAATGAEVPAIALLFSLRALTRRRRNAVADYPL